MGPSTSPSSIPVLPARRTLPAGRPGAPMRLGRRLSMGLQPLRRLLRLAPSLLAPLSDELVCQAHIGRDSREPRKHALFNALEPLQQKSVVLYPSDHDVA